MKKLNYTILLLLVLGFVSSCEKFENTAEESGTTFLPKMNLEGSSYVVVPCNGVYADAGIDVTEKGATIDHSVSVHGAYFGADVVGGSDLYTIGYSAYNVDSIPGSAFRTVLVEPCNTGAEDDIAGLYTADVLRSNGEGYVVSNIFIVRTGDNTFALSDALGGFYDLGRAYGNPYSSQGGIITVNDYAGNDFSVSQSWVPGFDFTTEVSDFTITDKVISFNALASFGGEWTVSLSPK